MKIELKVTDPRMGESINQYIYRMGVHKDEPEYRLGWSSISYLINKHFEKKMSSDFIRHKFYGMADRDEIEIAKDEGYTKVLIMNDLHIPYQREDVLQEIEKNKDVDYIVFGGDLADCKSCSFYPDFNKPSIEEELVLVHDFITKVNDIVNPAKTKIISIRGNHEFRYTRDIMKMQEKHLAKMLNPQMLNMIQNGFTYYDKNKDIHYKAINNFEYVDDFYIKLFDNLVVCHPLDFSAVDGRLCEKVAEYFLNEDITEKDDVIVFGHTHKMSSMKVNRRQGVFVIENGSLCLPQNYSKMGKLNYTPQNSCYTLLKFKEGEKINLNDIKIVHLD